MGTVTGVWSRAVVALGLAVVAAVPPGAQDQKSDVKQRDRLDQSQRQEGQAVLTIADAALAGKPVPADFQIRWQNEFLKARQGTFVPFTLTIDVSALGALSALMYVRAVPRDAVTAPARPAKNRKSTEKGRGETPEVQYPVDAIFPVELKPESGGVARISRGFSVAPGDYDIYIVVRERSLQTTSTASSRGPQMKAAVLVQPISVPNFWSGELTTSTVILADRLNVLSEPISPDELVERPYVIGQNDITPAADFRFRKDEELIVVFLVYNPTVTPDKKFDIQVEYHFFRRNGPGGRADTPVPAVPHPPERDGEKYFNHTDPQRFNPAIMGAQFDPNAGHPVMAGQGIPLAGFDFGDYRLAIKITDLLSGQSITRDVHFTVGS
jgi:hypothetical protein